MVHQVKDSRLTVIEEIDALYGGAISRIQLGHP